MIMWALPEIMWALPEIQMTCKLSFRKGDGMMVDWDPAVGAGPVTCEEDIRARHLHKSSNGRSLGSI